MRKIYAVITADIIHSRDHEDFSEKLKEKLNSFERELLVKPFSISRGDELQGVLGFIETLPVLLRRLRYTVKPIELRIGVGIGDLDNNELETSKSSWDMTGNVFFDARAALDRVKEEKKTRTIIESGDKVIDLSLNTIFLLLDTIQNGWTDKQWEAIHVYEREGTFEKAAGHLNVSIQNVQKHCDSAKWRIVNLAEENMRDFLKEISDNNSF